MAQEERLFRFIIFAPIGVWRISSVENTHIDTTIIEQEVEFNHAGGGNMTIIKIMVNV